MKNLNKFIAGLIAEGRKTFTHADVVDALGVSGPKASQLIQEYLRLLGTDRGSELPGVIYRKNDTRTTNAVWVIGNLSIDVRTVVEQTKSDVENRVASVLSGHLTQMSLRNAPSKKAVGLALIRYSLAQQALGGALDQLADSLSAS